jgi:hypothetical protein
MSSTVSLPLLQQYEQLTLVLRSQIKPLLADLEEAEGIRRCFLLTTLAHVIATADLSLLVKLTEKHESPRSHAKESIDMEKPAFLRRATGVSLGRIAHESAATLLLKTQVGQALALQAWLRQHRGTFVNGQMAQVQQEQASKAERFNWLKAIIGRATSSEAGSADWSGQYEQGLTRFTALLPDAKDLELQIERSQVPADFLAAL